MHDETTITGNKMSDNWLQRLYDHYQQRYGDPDTSPSTSEHKPQR